LRQEKARHHPRRVEADGLRIGYNAAVTGESVGAHIMALFGYPRAQENDAERAARAGLALLRALVA